MLFSTEATVLSLITDNDDFDDLYADRELK